jgi:hypothetical protein
MCWLPNYEYAIAVSSRDDPTMTGRVLLDLLDMTSLVTATVQVENNNRLPASNEKLANGVNVGTNYRVYGIDKVNMIQKIYYVKKCIIAHILSRYCYLMICERFKYGRFKYSEYRYQQVYIQRIYI